MSKHILKHELLSLLFLQIPLLTLFSFQSKVLIHIDIPELQFIALLSVILINWLFFRLAHKIMKQVSNHYYCLNFILTVACFSLAGFSQDELQQLGFIFPDKDNGTFLYFMYKTLFNLIGFYNFPNALQLFLGREKFRDTLIGIIKRN